jgi:hypothetical protein
MENKGKTNSVVSFKRTTRLLRFRSKRNLLARITSVAVALCCSTHLEAVEPREKICHVLLASKRCVNLIGEWRDEGGEGFATRTLQVMAPTASSTFPFSLEVIRGGSITHIEGSFALKRNVGLYSEANGVEADRRCTLVFIPTSSRQVDVTSFGSCEEGFGTSPDSIYVKKSK